jgi:hypothetical protein
MNNIAFGWVLVIFFWTAFPIIFVVIFIIAVVALVTKIYQALKRITSKKTLAPPSTPNPAPLTITNAPASLYYKQSVILTASEPVTWSSNSKMLKVDPNTGRVEGVRSFIKTGTATITATSLDGQRTASVNIAIKPTFGQWLVIILLFGWIWY